MITKASNQTGKLRTVPVFSDLGMMVEFYRSKIWKNLFNGNQKAYWTVFLWLFAVKVEMFGLLLRSVFRYNFGRHTSGFLLSIWTVSMLVALNANAVEGYLFTLVPFGAPILMIGIEWETFLNLIWFNVRSQNVVILTAVFWVFHLIHVVRIYADKGEIDDHLKRGSSWIKRLFPHSKFITEFKIQCFIEPIIGIISGYLFWVFGDDVWMFFILSISGFCLFIQEFSDHAYQYYHDRYT